MLTHNSEIAVFGGTGFIGRHLVSLLVDNGYRVRVVSRQFHAPVASVTYVRADMSDEAGLRAAVDGTSAVFHLATGGGERWSDFERDIVQGTRNLALAAQRCGVQRFIYTSSIAALYLGRREKIDERTGPDPVSQQRSFYSRSKAAAEAVLNRLHTEDGFPVVIFRPGLVVGAGGVLTHGGLGNWPSDTCCVGWGTGRFVLPFVLVKDVVTALVAAIDAPGIDGSTFNLVGDVRISASEFVQILAARSYRPFRFYPQSLLKLQSIEVLKWVAKIAARKVENPFPSYRDLTSRSLRAEFDCSAAKRMLGWTPVADRELFLREAIDANLPPIHASDLRLATGPIAP